MKVGDFLRDTRAGATSLAAAAVTVMTVGASALLVDHLWLVDQRDTLKSASDAGTVAATLEMNRRLAADPWIDDATLLTALEDVARRYIVLSFGHLPDRRRLQAIDTLVTTVIPDRALGTVVVHAAADLGGTLMSRELPMLGNFAGPFVTETESKVERSKVPAEVVLAIDVSLSMSFSIDGTPRVPEPDSRMHAIRQASLTLVEALDPSAEHLIAVGLVPWHVLVRLDETTKDHWDHNNWARYPATRRYAHPYQYDSNFDAPPAVVDTLAPSPPSNWSGCLDEHRITNLSRDAAWPTSDQLLSPPSTMAFAQAIFPAIKHYSYACLAEPLPDGLRVQYCYTDRQVSDANASKQKTRSGQGMCAGSTTTMLPLTSERAKIEAAIDNLTPIGQGTYSTLGVLWAHRMLSPSWKSTWGDAIHPLDPTDSHERLQKAIVLLTDGEDNYCGSSHDACMTSEVGIDQSEACTLAKSEGTQIFVVAAMAPDKVSGTLAQSLRDCSSQSDYPDGQYVFINNSDDADLRAAFVEIANQLQAIRKIY